MINVYNLGESGDHNSGFLIWIGLASKVLDSPAFKVNLLVTTFKISPFGLQYFCIIRSVVFSESVFLIIVLTATVASFSETLGVFI